MKRAHHFFPPSVLQEVPQPQSGWKIKRFVSTTTPHRTPTRSLCVLYVCISQPPTVAKRKQLANERAQFHKSCSLIGPMRKGNGNKEKSLSGIEAESSFLLHSPCVCVLCFSPDFSVAEQACGVCAPGGFFFSFFFNFNFCFYKKIHRTVCDI